MNNSADNCIVVMRNCFGEQSKKCQCNVSYDYEVMRYESIMKIVTLHSVQDIRDFCSMFTYNFFRIGQ